ncbi:MAG: response regulator receiver protein [Hyphomicrobiales bacterium]|nr:response regulator receiver protein [Hyphomicrobiales bacterium]
MIVIVEDDDSVRVATESLVRSLGFATASFSSAEYFIASPCVQDTACLIVDVQMPGMSGIELQRLLQEKDNKTPVIFITAFPEERIRRQAVAAGAIGFLSKPFDGNALIDCIERALGAGSECRP